MMKYILIIIIFFSLPIDMQAQVKEDSTEALVLVNPLFGSPPDFPGGYDSLNAFIKKNINWKNITGCAEGKVYVKFIVDKNGCVINPEVIKGISREYDHEALRIVKLFPKWEPGTQNGIPVKVQMVYPIRFSGI